MVKNQQTTALTRRELLRISTLATVGGSMLGAGALVPESAWAAGRTFAGEAQTNAGPDAYGDLLQTWCDGLVDRQVVAMDDPALRGGLLCPACGLIHGRCADAVYPLLRMAHTTGEAKYLESALAVYDWAEQQVSRSDGSWVNDVTLSSWKGITVFRSISLAEALLHHGTILDGATTQRWTERLARAAKFLDGFITIETGNINYPVTASLAFTLCAQVLGESRYQERGRQLAHAALEYFTANDLLYGEGHPLQTVTKKGCRPVDLGYNVEESLPALALYGLLNKDQAVLDRTVAALRTHMEFLLPDGGWDNSWGTRNYKWSWWGSRTSDGCHPAYVLLSPQEPRFLEVARRNLELMAACTQDGLLYGGPGYSAHGDRPCIHHTFTHAKALATVLDRGSEYLGAVKRATLPCDAASGLKHYPEIGTQLASIGPWRATVTEYDWEYEERVQADGSDAGGGGCATGGAMSLLYHRGLGPILVASMTEYRMIEISNQQAFTDAPHMTLTSRIECRAGATYTSLSDLEATVTTKNAADEIGFDVHGRLQTAGHKPLPTGEVHYHLDYRLRAATVSIVATAGGARPPSAPLEFILPIVSPAAETVEQPAPGTIRIIKPKGAVVVRTDAAQGFSPVPKERTFNLVPGFECVPLVVTMEPGRPVTISIEAAMQA